VSETTSYIELEERITSKILENYRNNSNGQDNESFKFKCLSNLVNYLFNHKSEKHVFKIINNSINLVLTLYDNSPVDVYSGTMQYSENLLNKFNFYVHEEFDVLDPARQKKWFQESILINNDSLDEEKKEECLETIRRFHKEHEDTYFCILDKKSY